MLSTEQVVKTTSNWVETVVIELNLCPFAKREWVQQKVCIEISSADNEAQLLRDLVEEFGRLMNNQQAETTLLVHPYALLDFNEYNQFLDLVDMALEEMSLDGVLQVASFHPDYQFADTEFDDSENYSNRSPYPILHILREASLEAAIDAYADTANIPVANIQKLRLLGSKHMAKLLENCQLRQ